ncbi:hypothetical protein BJX70DRAFT_374683 [Aspergillus crustosus]
MCWIKSRDSFFKGDMSLETRKRNNTGAEREVQTPRKKGNREQKKEDYPSGDGPWRRAGDALKDGWDQQTPCMRVRQFCCRCDKIVGVNGISCGICRHERCPVCLIRA